MAKEEEHLSKTEAEENNRALLEKGFEDAANYVNCFETLKTSKEYSETLKMTRNIATIDESLETLLEFRNNAVQIFDDLKLAYGEPFINACFFHDTRYQPPKFYELLKAVDKTHNELAERAAYSKLGKGDSAAA